MLVDDLERMIDSGEEAAVKYETNSIGRSRMLLLRYRPPGEGELDRHLSVSRLGVEPSQADLRMVEHALHRATAVHHLTVSGPHVVQQNAVYYVYRLAWREKADQPQLL